MIAQTRWRKSSRSGATENGCVELAHTRNVVRDSKNPTGPTLRVNAIPLLGAIKAGDLDR